MSDTKKLLQKFCVKFRGNLKAMEIYHSIEGLTPYDREEILSEKNNILAVDKLVDSVGRRSTGTFVSFVHALETHGHEEIANDIIKESEMNFKNLHNILVRKPIATVSPSTHSYAKERSVENTQQSFRSESPPGVNRSTDSVGTGALQNDATNSDFQDEDLSLDSELCMAAYDDVLEWIAELNKDDNWKEVAKKQRLNYRFVKSLEKHENPGEKLFDENLSKLRVREFIEILDKANLCNISRMVEFKITLPRVQASGNTLDQPTGLQDRGLQNFPPLSESGNNDLNMFESLTDNTQVDEDHDPATKPRVSVTQGSMNVVNNLTIERIENLQLQQSGSVESNPNLDFVMKKLIETTDNSGMKDDEAGSKGSIREDKNSTQGEDRVWPFVTAPENEDKSKSPEAEYQNLTESALKQGRFSNEDVAHLNITADEN